MPLKRAISFPTFSAIPETGQEHFYVITEIQCRVFENKNEILQNNEFVKEGHLEQEMFSNIVSQMNSQ